MITREEAISTMKEVEAFLTGHFLLSSGKHSNGYCQCAKLLQYPDKAAEVLALVADQVKGLDFDMVVGPAMGGIVVSYEIARQTGRPGIFTERENNVMTLRRGFEIKPGQKVLITEDVVTTGKSSLETAELLKGLGAEVIGICCIVDRRPENVEIPYPIYSAIKLDIDTYDPTYCPLCKEGIPYVKPGSRKIS